MWGRQPAEPELNPATKKEVCIPRQGCGAKTWPAPFRVRLHSKVTRATPSHGRKREAALHCMLQELSCAHCILWPLRMDHSRGRESASSARARGLASAKGRKEMQTRPSARYGAGHRRAAIGSERPHPVLSSLFLRKTIKATQRRLMGWGALHRGGRVLGTSGLRSC